MQTAAIGAVCVFCRSRLEILEKVLRVILQITQSRRRGRERATKRFLHARVVGRIIQEENLRRRNELAICHFVVAAELRKVQVWKNATNLLECQLEPISKGVSTHVHKFGVLSFEFLL